MSTDQSPQATEPGSNNDHDDEDDYRGPVTLIADEQEVEASVTLRGYFEPIDGKYHWYGRIAASETVTALAGNGRKTVTVRTPQGSAEGKLTDPDMWGRLRVSGIGNPPFYLETDLEKIE